MAKFLDYAGLTTFWAKIKAYVTLTSNTSGGVTTNTIKVGNTSVNIPNRVGELSDGGNLIKGLSASGTTITYTKADNTTGTISTQDTKVRQNPVSSGSTEYAFLLRNGGTGTSAVTNEVNYINSVTVNPNGEVTATKFKGLANVSTGLNVITCGSSADRSDKNIVLPGFVLSEGARLIIKFTNENSAASPTLEVNGTGAKPIYVEGVQAGSGLPKGRTYYAMYDGSKWQLTVYSLFQKADKIVPSAANNLAALDAQGNLVDSGVSASSAGTDTKNTTGSTQDTSKLFLVGAKSQAANPQTYSNSKVYISSSHLYSNGVQVVNLSGSQALTHKTYEGYTLGAACAKGVVDNIATASDANLVNLATAASVKAYVENTMTGAAMFKGTLTSSSQIEILTTYKKGWYWVVATAGKYLRTKQNNTWVGGEDCEAGDMIFCVSDCTGTYAAADFSIVQSNLDIKSITDEEIEALN
jgi:hypothetical protein